MRDEEMGDYGVQRRSMRQDWVFVSLVLGLVLESIVACMGQDGKASAEGKTAPEPIVLAPGKVVIDGDLKDWDKSGKVGPAAFDAEAADEYNATFYAMYDKEFLYLAAVVVQTHPPYNTFPLKGVGAWNGDDVIVRMSSNPQIKVPIQMSQEQMAKSPDLFTAEFWWNHLRKEPYWDGYHGISPDRTLRKEDMPGTDTAVKIKGDGLGYTLEAKVPWKLINPNFSAKPGDHIAFTWEVSVANNNPAEPKRIFQIFANGGGTWAFTNPAMWGEAILK